MLFYELSLEDKEYLVEAFQQDGFKIVEQDDELVVEKLGDKIILDSLRKAKFHVDFPRFLFQKQILTQSLSGGFDVDSLTKFLKNEKKQNEGILDCLKRTAIKFNWHFVYLGTLKINKDEDDVQYLELQTDDGKVVTLVNFKGKPDKIYALESYAFKLQQILRFDERDYFRDMAPNAYLALQAITGI